MGNFDNKVIAAVMTKSGDSGRVVGRSLKNLRLMVGLTQKQLAQRLGVSRSTISKFEQQEDLQISTLEKYVEALGGKLNIHADFSLDAINFKEEVTNERQLMLPIFNEGSIESKRDIVISIRPEYSERILEGKKTVELRRRFPADSPQNMVAYIYCTSPTMAMVGCVVVSKVIKLPINEIWEKYASVAFIKKEDFVKYFSGLDEGYVLELKHVKPLSRQVGLKELRERFDFTPPQSFFYAKPKLLKALQDEYSNVSH